jgi:sugar lactone lactonase YvrE
VDRIAATHEDESRESDNRADQIYRVKPADFLDKDAPRVTVVASGKSLNPNGLYPAKDVHALSPGGEIKRMSTDLGRPDGVYQLDDETLLVTDWNSGWLARWSEKEDLQPL